MRLIIIVITILLSGTESWAQVRALNLPTSGITGAVGIGFVDFTTIAPANEFELNRGTYIAASVERPFNFLNLHLVLTLSHMSADGNADYNYTKDGVNFLANDLPLQARMMDLGLGLKFKLIENYWFRPYVGGGGLGGYHEVSFSSTSTLAAQGSGYKTKDTIMNSGYYGEAGLEIEFSERFGVQLAGRMSNYSSKTLSTLGGKRLLLSSETYYLSALIGF